MFCLRFVSTCLLVCTASVVFAEESKVQKFTPDELKFFETKIRPVLIRECYGCHSNKSGNVRGGLRMDTKQMLLIGGGSGPAVVPGKPDESYLYTAMKHEDFVMPPKRKLSDKIIADFKKWIEMGAPDPRVSSLGTIKSTITKEDIRQAKETFWAYQQPVLNKPQKVEHSKWPRTQIDHYVLAKLEQSDMTPAQDAEAWKIIRRLSFDLVGLPPSPAVIASFTSAWKRNPDRAVADVVDRLLKKDQFGERWGRHWLDVARYAESTGTAVNMTYPHAWRYRDYVIDAFNNDKPFDQFVQEQIAGDLMRYKDDDQFAEQLVATTFLAIGAKDVNEDNRVQFAANVADEQIDATTRVFLGMSVSCARCHDHKFDPIPQEDYYALAGVFKNTKTYFGHPQSKYGSYSGAQEKQTSTLLILPIDDPNPFDPLLSKSEMNEIIRQMEDTRRDRTQQRGDRNAANANRQRAVFQATMAGLSGKLAYVDENGKPYSWTMGVQETDKISDSRLLVRGEIAEPAQTVSRGFPQVLTGRPVSISSKSSGRLELAKWIGNKDNPLTARVMVNRIWQHLLGQGIVSSTENFGATGQLPTHPELLDYLAVRFVESGWSVKTIVREIVTSRVYRMSSKWDEEFHELDPDNKLLWRANPRRLDAEAIRDAMLRVSGELDLKRPRASVVAEAGFTRIRDGQLVSPAARAGMSGRGMRGMQGDRPNQGNKPGAGDRSRPGQRPGNRSRPGMQRPNRQPPVGRRFAGGPGGRPGGRVTNPLDAENEKYRSIYLPIVREEEPRSLKVFDLADSSTVTGTREKSNNANQALYMLNNPFVLQQSQAFAARLSRSGSTTTQINQAFLLTYGRSPTADEREAAYAFLRNTTSGSSRQQQNSTLALFCQSLFASAEFRFVD